VGWGGDVRTGGIVLSVLSVLSVLRVLRVLRVLSVLSLLTGFAGDDYRFPFCTARRSFFFFA
jgi:hypothetical protein